MMFFSGIVLFLLLVLSTVSAFTKVEQKKYLDFVLTCSDDFDFAYHSSRGGWETYFQVSVAYKMRTINSQPLPGAWTDVVREVYEPEHRFVDLQFIYYPTLRRIGIYHSIEIKVENLSDKDSGQNFINKIRQDIDRQVTQNGKRGLKKSRYALSVFKTKMNLTNFVEYLGDRYLKYCWVIRGNERFAAVLIDVECEETDEEQTVMKRYERMGDLGNLLESIPSVIKYCGSPEAPQVRPSLFQQDFLDWIISEEDFNYYYHVLNNESQKKWEPAAQIQIARRLKCDKRFGYDSDIREIKYPESSHLADFSFTLDGYEFVVELKVALRSHVYSKNPVTASQSRDLYTAVINEELKMVSFWKWYEMHVHRYIVVMVRNRDDNCEKLLRL